MTTSLVLSVALAAATASAPNGQRLPWAATLGPEDLSQPRVMQSPGTSCVLTRLANDSIQPGDEFGFSVGIDSPTVVVGAIRGDSGPTNSGYAVVYRLLPDGGHAVEQILAPNDPQPEGRFGRSVDIEGDTIVVGALGTEGSRGSVYVFEEGSDGVWTQTQKLQDPEAGPLYFMGQEVCISGNRILVGSAWYDGIGDRSGCALLYELQPSGIWHLAHRFRASDEAAGDEFGTDVAIDDGIAVIGAAYDDDNGTGTGAVYVFEEGPRGWVETKIVPELAPAGGNLGISVDTIDGVLAAGAHRSGIAGTTYVMTREAQGQWATTEVPAPDSLGGNAQFGWRISLDPPYLAVAARLAHGEGRLLAFQGFAGGEWAFAQELASPSSPFGSEFGSSCAMDRGELVVGARFANSNDGPIGAGYSWRLSCLCLSDVDQDGQVGIGDLLLVLAQWGGCPPVCPAEIDGDGVVSFEDLILVLSNWGPCG